MQKRRIFKRTVPVALIIVLLASLLAIPVGAAPPKEKVTSPLEFFGYNIGDDYQLTPWQTREVPNQGVRKGIVDYMYELERTSNRVRVFPYGTSTEGRPMFYVVITSPSNWAQVDNYQAINKLLADPRQIASDEEAMSLAEEGKAVYWVDAGIHASERTAGETEIIMAYELASGRDEWTDLVLDNLFVVFEWIDPDGLDLITDYYYKYKDTDYVRGGVGCYNHYVCHDTNRDFIGLELVEHQNSVLQRFVWNPQIYTDLHQTRDLFYIGMPADPLNLNYHPISSAEMLGLNGYVITQMIADGYRGVFTYDYADMWNPTYNHMFTVMHNGTGGWWELTGVTYATPRTVTASRNDGHRTWFNPYPYFAPFEWHLIDAVNLEKEAIKHSFTYVARNKVDWLYNFYLKGKTHAEEAAGAAPYAFVIPADGGENGDNVDVAEMINDFTMWQHIDVDRATADFVADGQQFHAGDFVIRLNQPYGFWAQVLLTRQDFPYEELVNPYLCDRSGGCREYDTQAWTQGLLRDVEVVGLESPLPDVGLTPVTDPVPNTGGLGGGPSADYAVEHESNNGWVPALGQIWADPGMSVSQADAPFSAAGHDFPAGTFLVHTDGSQASHDTLAALVQETGLTGYAIGSGEVPDSAALNFPNIGLYYETNLSSLETGWVAIRMDRSTIPYTQLSRGDIRDGNLAGLDVIVLGSASTSSIVNGRTGSTTPPEYYGGIDDSGVANLKSFVEGGGTLVLLGRAGELPIDREWGLGLTNASSPACRGSILRIEVDPATKVGYGYDPFEVGYVYDSRVPVLGVESGSPAQVVAWYPTEGELLLSGYIEPGGDAVFRGTPAILDVPMGDGNVILITFDTVFRGFSTGQYMFLWNAVFSGAR
jgi:hypothetical protein